MPASNRLKNQHLLWRAAFGPMADNIASLDDTLPADLWKLLLKRSGNKPTTIAVSGLVDSTQDMAMEITPATQTNAELRKRTREQSRDGLRALNLRWLNEMVHSEAQFRERMSLFWHGHFACRVINIKFQEQLLEIIRTHAFGNFGDLLKAVSRCPAMLQFLNNQQNRKQRANENFAREVMELFTLGRGNYSEVDVKEAARAFTGWGFNLQGEFISRETQHDNGIKTFLGRSGNFNGDDILNILLEQKSTALFIARKVYAHFVNEQPDDRKIAWLANRFFKTGYDIELLMTDIFTSDWFYSDKNIGTKIKSPVELLVGMRRLLPMHFKNEGVQLSLQRSLGQVLFYPPNVAGWPGGKTWIDSSTLMVRLRSPKLMAGITAFKIKPKPDDDTMMGQMGEDYAKDTNGRNSAAGILPGAIDWEAVIKIFQTVPRQLLLQKLVSSVLQTKTSPATIPAKYINNSSREQYISSAILYLVSTPEYQLC